jgi:hypothetical protein
MTRWAWLIGGCVLLAACGSDDADEAGAVEITFDGASCEYRGPDRLPTGMADFAFLNESDIVASGVVLLITDDRTYDDVEELSRSDPDWNGDEEWSELVSPAASVAPGNTYEWVTDLAAGRHYVVCLDADLESFFYGGGFTVEP